MTALPREWAWSTVGEVGKVMLGRQRSPKYHSGPNMRPYLRVKNVFEDRIELSDVKEMDFSPADYERYRLEPGDILLNEGQSPELIGRPAMYRGELPGACFTNSLIRFRPHSGVDDLYALYLFRHYLRSGRFRREARITTNIAHLSAQRFSLMEFPVPPTAEQLRIAAAIEEQFSRLDAAEVSLRRALRRTSLLKKAILASVVPHHLPNGWRLSTVGEAGEVQLGRQRSPRYHSGPHMRPYLRVANVFEDRLDLSDVMKMDFPPGQYARYVLEPGDILLNEGQSPELVGRPAMYRGELPGTCFTNSLIRFQPGPDVDQDFALLVFRSHLHSGRFRREARITTNIAHMAAGRFKTVEFPVPPLDEQRRIVADVGRQLSFVDAMRAELSGAQRRSTALRRTILDRAFTGKLVAQDPSDEPASVLLDRIATERIARETPRRRKIRK